MRTRVHTCILATLVLGIVAGCEERPNVAEIQPQEESAEIIDAADESPSVREPETPDSPSERADAEGKAAAVPTMEAPAVVGDLLGDPKRGGGPAGDGDASQGKLLDVLAKVDADGKHPSAKVGSKGQAVSVKGEAYGLGGLGLRGVGRGGGGSAGVGLIGSSSGSSHGYGKGSANVGYGRSTGGARSGRAHYPKLRAGSPMVMGRAAPPRERTTSESYTHYGTNRFTDTATDALSTFSIDVDTGAYTIARRKLNEGAAPPASSVRVEEFVNYFSYAYPAPKNDAFSVALEAAPSPFSADKNRYVVRVGVQGKRVEAIDRKPVHLTFLVDVSGSMRSPDKLQLAKKSLKFLTQNLRGEDTVALATYAGGVRKVLEPTGMERRGEILAAIDGLNAGGSTGMNDGLKLAYDMALEKFHASHVNRVIVLSDGDANVGPNTHDEILKRIKGYVDEGVTLSTIGFGMGNYKDTMMEQLANKGNGNYYYVDSFKEARKIFGDQLDGTLQIIAKDVKIQVEFEKDVVSKYRLIGYENRDIADKDFRNDAVDAGEIGAGHTVTALYEIELKNPSADKIATVRIRHKEPRSNSATERAFRLGANDVRPSIGKASVDFQWAAAVAGFAELLRKSPYSKDLSWDLVLEVAQASTKGRADREELVRLIKRAKEVS